MAYGACYLKGTRFFDRGGMIAGLSPRSARWPIGIAAFGLCQPLFSNKEFRLGPGKRWQQQKGRGPCSCCARPLSSRFGIYYKRENPLQITTSLLGSVWNGRERTKWIYNPSREWSYVNSRLMENNFHVRFREHFFR